MKKETCGIFQCASWVKNRTVPAAGTFRKSAALCAMAFLLALSLSACGQHEEGTPDAEGGNTKVILTTGFARGEIFRIGSISCMKNELMVYLTNTQNQYENVFGEEI